MYYLGLDISLRKTGWGLVEKKDGKIFYSASGLIKTKISLETGYHSDSLALKDLYQSIFSLFQEYQPHHCSIENSYVNSNPLSSLKLAQARAMGLLASAEFGLLPREYQASTVKKIVAGKGTASKDEVLKLLQLQLGKFNINNHDESDALALALCHALYH